MAFIKLYIATSLDGFIAREDGSLDWLPGSDPNSTEEMEDGGYSAFFESIDVVVLGRATYEEVLGFDVDWPYVQQKCVVLTRKAGYKVSTPNTEVINELNAESINYIRSMSKKNVWLTGGGEVISEFLNHGAIDEMILNVFPIVLGKGIRLFLGEPPETRFELTNVERFKTGFVNLTYKLRS